MDNMKLDNISTPRKTRRLLNLYRNREHKKAKTDADGWGCFEGERCQCVENITLVCRWKEEEMEANDGVEKYS